MNVCISIALVANLIAYAQMAIDKQHAVKHRRRISETQLVLPVVIGGFLGALLGMLAFRHKTKKRSFHLKLLFALILFSISTYYFATR